ncbi:MAG TPA: fibronectin type III domain-containing protein [Deltaproteobacteria bacterium]|nr:fibronectin type III domain-containing protein [Deltaproteobacteria bacterium]
MNALKNILTAQQLTSLRTAIVTIIAALMLPAAALGADVTLQWDPNSEPDIGGYKIYYGTAPRTYGEPIDVGNVTEYVVKDLKAGAKYYFAATAYNTDGYESDFSNEVTWGTPAPPVMRIGHVDRVVINGDASITIAPGAK